MTNKIRITVSDFVSNFLYADEIEIIDNDETVFKGEQHDVYDCEYANRIVDWIESYDNMCWTCYVIYLKNRD